MCYGPGRVTLSGSGGYPHTDDWLNISPYGRVYVLPSATGRKGAPLPFNSLFGIDNGRGQDYNTIRFY